MGKREGGGHERLAARLHVVPLAALAHCSAAEATTARGTRVPAAVAAGQGSRARVMEEREVRQEEEEEASGASGRGAAARFSLMGATYFYMFACEMMKMPSVGQRIERDGRNER